MSDSSDSVSGDFSTDPQQEEEVYEEVDMEEDQDEDEQSEYELDWEDIADDQQTARRQDHENDEEAEIEGRFPSNLWSLKNLRRLQLKNYPFSTLPDRIGTLTKLKELQLEDTQIETLPSSISRLVDLERLDIMATPLKAFPVEMMQLPNLQIVSFCDYPLPILPKGLFSLTSIKRLELRTCEQLSELPREVCNLQGLEYLDIQCSENLTVIPSEITQLQNLKDLGMVSHEAVPMEFLSKMTQLEILRLFVSTPAVPDELRKLQNLKELSLKCSFLEVMPSFLNQFPKLEVLDIMSFDNPLDIPFCPQIKDLRLSYYDRGSIVKLVADARWRQGSRLEKLTIESVPLGDNYVEILDWIPSSVHELRFIDCDIDDFDGFVDHPLPQGIRSLECANITGQGYDDRFCSSRAAKVLLERHQDLTCINDNFFKNVPSHIVYQLYFNFYGRKLLRQLGQERTKPVTLSVWSTVLEKIGYGYGSDPILSLEASLGSNVSKEMKASVTYALLQGPALLGRAHMPSRCKRQWRTTKRYKSSKKPRF